jgi:predicted secreted protein
MSSRAPISEPGRRSFGRALVGAFATAFVLVVAGTALAASVVTVTVAQSSSTKAINETKHVALHKGGKLQIAFNGNWYDSGYAWTLTHKPASAVLKYAGSTTKSSGKCCGFPETITYIYKVVGTGTTEVRYTLRGPGNNTKSSGAVRVVAKVS